MKPLTAAQAKLNGLFYEHLPYSHILTFNSTMAQILKESKVAKSTVIEISPSEAASLTLDLVNLGYEVEQIASDALHVSWK